MEAIEELLQLSDSMRQGAAILADEDVDENTTSSRRASSFLNVVALGNVRDGSLSSKSITLQIDNKSQQVSASALRHSLQGRLGNATGKTRDEINLKLRTSTAPPLKLIDLPGLDQRIMDESMISEYAEHNDSILLVIVLASQAPEVASYRALRVIKEYDADESSPRSSSSGASGDDWRYAFDAATNGPVDRSSSLSRSSSNGHSRYYSDPAQNGDVNSGPNSGSHRTPNRLPPAPPGSSGSRYF